MERPPTFDLFLNELSASSIWGVLLIPVAIELLQPDTGTAMVYFAMLQFLFGKVSAQSVFHSRLWVGLALTLLTLGISRNNIYLAVGIGVHHHALS